MRYFVIYRDPNGTHLSLPFPKRTTPPLGTRPIPEGR